MLVQCQSVHIHHFVKSWCFRTLLLPHPRAYSNGAVQPILCSPKSRMCSPSCKIVQSKICALDWIGSAKMDPCPTLSYIALYVHYCMIVYFPLLFSNFSSGIYKRYTQLMRIASPWNSIGIWHTGTCCPDIRHFNKYTSGIYCILREFQHITGLISCGWYSEVYSSHCISLLYDCTVQNMCFKLSHK